MNREGVADSQRTEAFSDGVFAIAITLLGLDLKAPQLDPPVTSAALMAALLAQWPNYMAFVSSFVTILIMWVHHHRIFALMRGIDLRAKLANGLVLLLVTAVPFTTAVLAEYYVTPAAGVACTVYAATFILINVSYTLLWLAADAGGLLKEHVGPALRRTVTRTLLLGYPFYVAAAAWRSSMRT